MPFRFSFSLFLLSCFSIAVAQKQKKANLVYVDKKGILRYTATHKEASFFGVNYTVPFAYGYRSHKALGADLEQAIDADVYHMSRLGLNAFRVHVWDVEISDSLGNLLNNEHLRLFDYLLLRLKERGIRILITPIAFWGNGYPEPDIKTNGFSYVYGKGNAVVKEEAIKAQENYLRQFFTHVNPYTKLSYRDDPDVIATEINNEPHHSGPKEKTTAYIDRLETAIRSAGWTKPIFYNISESPSYADAVAASKVDGFSFQWYPTGLVSNHEQKGNFLSNVDQYHIPFVDTISSFLNKARMVYEFDAGDVLQPIMYPAMARSFRTAGFQWATQFAYDPMATAYANTEYQTHYLNLAYTPKKAISLLIASKAFQRLPLFKSYGTYPADSVFDVFRVSYQEQLSEMNTEEEFYYSNNTQTTPKNRERLNHIAGTGSSPVVQYEGSGAYFFDKLSNGDWRLEVMPDVIALNDPFEKASPKKTVVATAWNQNHLHLTLPGWERFTIRGYNNGNNYLHMADDGFSIAPGVYILSKGQMATPTTVADTSFFAPRPYHGTFVLTHHPLSDVSGNKPFSLATDILTDSSVSVTIELRNSANKWRTLTMKQTRPHHFEIEVPADMVLPGLLNYRFMVRSGSTITTFPGGIPGDPYAWDQYVTDSYQTFVSANHAPVELFNTTADRNKLMLYNTDWRNNTILYTAANTPNQLVLEAKMNKPLAGQIMAWQFYFGDKIAGRKNELGEKTKLVIRARSDESAIIKVSLISTEGAAYTTTIQLSAEMREYKMELSDLKPGAMLLLPRPYPGFQPLMFSPGVIQPFVISSMEKLEVSFMAGDKPAGIAVEKIWLQ